MITIKNKMTLTENDYLTICKLECKLFSKDNNTLNYEEIKKMLDNISFRVVIYKDRNNEILGYCIFSFFEKDADIFKIGVNENFQKKGIGSKILDKIKTEYSSIILEVSKRDKTIEFYLKNKFKVKGIRKKYYNDGSDAIILEWNKNKKSENIL